MASMRKDKAVVVGLDGVPRSLIARLCANGVTPRIAELAASSPLQEMTVTLPEISAVSWPSFCTGVGPGRHGVFGFTDLKPGTYDLRFTNAGDVKAPAIWDVLGAKKKRSVVINQPGTYPARPIGGVMIAGFVAIDFDRAVQPPAARPRLREMGYEIDVDTVACRTDHALLEKQLIQTLDGRRKAAYWLWDNETWDYFELVITGTDRLHHYMWDAVEDRNHPRHGFCMDYYRQVDDVVGALYDRASRAGFPFYLLSDHGFCSCRYEFYLSAWLEAEGYLSWEGEKRDVLAALAPNSRAFALDPNRIYFNYAGKYPRGCVRGADAPALAAEIKAKLSALVHGGRPVFQAVYERDELYEGPYAAAGPDLVAVAHNGFDVKAHLGKSELFAATDLTGMHTQKDAVFWAEGVTLPNGVITDVAGLLLRNFR